MRYLVLVKCARRTQSHSDIEQDPPSTPSSMHGRIDWQHITQASAKNLAALEQLGGGDAGA